MDVTLDLLSHTSTLDSQAMLDPMSQLVFGSLSCVGQQILNTVLTSHLDQLSLAALGVYGILPFPCHGVLVEAERVRSLLLVSSLGCVFGKDGGGGISGKEALQRSGQRLCEADELRC